MATTQGCDSGQVHRCYAIKRHDRGKVGEKSLMAKKKSLSIILNYFGYIRNNVLHMAVANV